MRWSSLVVFVAAALAFGCASPTETIPPPPTLPPTVLEPIQPPTETPAPATDTPKATDTSEPTAVPTEEPTPEDTDEAQAKPLEVAIVYLDYVCEQRCWLEKWWGYRSFHVSMKMRNGSCDPSPGEGNRPDTSPVPWRWTIIDGTNVRYDEEMWQWPANAVSGAYEEGFETPDIPLGEEQQWGWEAFPLHAGEWVAALQYDDACGNTYRQDFPRPEGGQFNYVDCDDPKEGSC